MCLYYLGKNYTMQKKKKPDKFNMYCNWDRDGLIPEYKTFVTSYYCLIFYFLFSKVMN